jgi:hypothetical protein
VAYILPRIATTFGGCYGSKVGEEEQSLARTSELQDKLKMLTSTPSTAAPEFTTPTNTPRPKLSRDLARKVSVSLYPTDLQKLTEIRQFMVSLGFRNLSDSEALRLGIRSTVLAENLRPLYEDMLQEDRRRKVG